MRLAEVWMDDYKRLYYRHRRDLQVEKNPENSNENRIDFFLRAKILVMSLNDEIFVKN